MTRFFNHSVMLQLCLLSVISFTLPSFVHAQEFAEGSEEPIGQDALKKVEERVKDALQRFEREGLTVGNAVGRIIRSDGESRSITVKDHEGGQVTFQKMPKKHPLLNNDGSESQGKSKEIYTQHDPQAILHDDTVAQCIEDRQVFVGDYLKQCAARCPGPWVKVQPTCPLCIPFLDPDCVLNLYYVSELYFPVYQSTTYAGRMQGSFDSNGSYLSGSDRKPEFKLKKVKSEYRSKGWNNFKKAYKDYTGESVKGGIEEYIPKHVWDQEWGGTDRTGLDDPNSPHPFHTIVYQTNPHRQMTRNRPKPVWEGYELQDNCFFHTLDDASKKVVSHASYGDKKYMQLQQAASESKKQGGSIDPMVVSATMIEDTLNIFQIAKQTDNIDGEKLPDIVQKLPPSQRAGEGKWGWMKKGLERIGIETEERTKEAVWYSIVAGPYYTNRNNSWTTPLYSAYSQAVSHYMVNAAPGFSPNKPKIRPLQYSLYTKPEGKGNYTGKLSSVEDRIIFTDKTQVLPPYDVGMDKGTHCFRPETLARVEPVKSDKDIDEKAGQHNGLRRDLAKLYPQYGTRGLNAANQVNVAYWIKRVNCYCTQCGVPYGCSVLNGGDHKKENFYGTTALNGSSPVMFIGGTTIPTGPMPQMPKMPSMPGLMNGLNAAGGLLAGGAQGAAAAAAGAAAGGAGGLLGQAAGAAAGGGGGLLGQAAGAVTGSIPNPGDIAGSLAGNIPKPGDIAGNIAGTIQGSIPNPGAITGGLNPGAITGGLNPGAIAGSFPNPGNIAGGFANQGALNGGGLLRKKILQKNFPKKEAQLISRRISRSLDFNRLARSGGANVGGPAINIPDWGKSFDESPVSPKGKTFLTNTKSKEAGQPGKTGKGTVGAKRSPSPGQGIDWFQIIQMILQGVQMICEPGQGGGQQGGGQQGAQQGGGQQGGGPICIGGS